MNVTMNGTENEEGTASVQDDDLFRNERLLEFSVFYSGIHGYLSLIVCVFGIPMNLINITVLTQKHMRTPINCILTWLAVSDMLTMLSYVPFVLHFYLLSNGGLSAERNSLGWMTYLCFHINFSNITHTASVWLGVTLAIFRYKHIYSPAKGNLTRMRRLIRARIAVVTVYALTTIGLIPNYMTNEMVSTVDAENRTMWILKDLKLGTPSVKPVVEVNLWVYSVLGKLLPCVLMAIYGSLLVWTLRAKLRDRRRKLSCTSNTSFRPVDSSRTTRMLLVVMVLFFVTEMPQVLLIFLSVTCKGFFQNVYLPLGDMMDMVALINNAVNFLLYCTMSRDFRRTMVKLVHRFLLVKEPSTHQPNGYIYTESEKSHAALIIRIT